MTGKSRFTLPEQPWNPWEALTQEHAGVTVVQHLELPGKIWGLSTPNDGGIVWLCKRLGELARLSTLAHELIHLERGIPSGEIGSPQQQAEELIVSEIAARRLIPLPNLIAVTTFEPTEDFEIWARLLGVAVPDVEVRLRTLTNDERDALDRQGRAAEQTG